MNYKPIGGVGGIRTHGGVSPTSVFKTDALSLSATTPSAPSIPGCHWSFPNVNRHFDFAQFVLFSGRQGNRTLGGLTASPAFQAGAENQHLRIFHGGAGGIRTPGGLSPASVFETGALNHSATAPFGSPYSTIQLSGYEKFGVEGGDRTLTGLLPLNP